MLKVGQRVLVKKFGMGTVLYDGTVMTYDQRRALADQIMSVLNCASEIYEQPGKEMTAKNLARTKVEVKTDVGGGSFKYPVTVPTGTLCRNLGTHWVVQQLDWLSKSDGAYHDAFYRGIVINESDLALED